jgi:hypothetical protein
MRREGGLQPCLHSEGPKIPKIMTLLFWNCW